MLLLPPKMPSSQLLIRVSLVPCMHSVWLGQGGWHACMHNTLALHSAPLLSTLTVAAAGGRAAPNRHAHPLLRVALPKRLVLLGAAACEGGAKAAGLEAGHQGDCSRGEGAGHTGFTGFLAAAARQRRRRRRLWRRRPVAARQIEWRLQRPCPILHGAPHRPLTVLLGAGLECLLLGFASLSD
jgi:hypothetical protein